MMDATGSEIFAKLASYSLRTWKTVRADELNEVEKALQSVAGIGRGRRYATLQLNHAYVMLLSSQFQGYCRDLHSECVEHLISKIEIPGVAPGALRNVLRDEFLSKRKLDAGNPNPGNIGEDFNRFVFDFWAKIKTYDSKNFERSKKLVELNAWRNAIGHQNFKTIYVNGANYKSTPYLKLSTVRIWRKTCDALALDFDSVMSSQIALLIGSPP